MRNINAEIIQSNASIIINFLQGQNESLVFDFKNKKIDGFCKWNGENQEEFYKIFDMFIELKPLFKSLIIDDDEGLWHDYIAQKVPCKIKLRSLHANEMKFLDRIKANASTPPNEIEKFVMDRTTLHPFHKSLLRAIVQDFIVIMGVERINDFNPQAIIDLTFELNFMGEGFKPSVTHFSFDFPKMLLQIWIGYTFEYKKEGVVKELPKDIRGLCTSMIAAVYGTSSIFLNCYVGINNSKEAEMHKLAKRYYRTGALGEVTVIDEPEKELEFFFSMMNYLGFTYVGVNENSTGN